MNQRSNSTSNLWKCTCNPYRYDGVQRDFNSVAASLLPATAKRLRSKGNLRQYSLQKLADSDMREGSSGMRSRMMTMKMILMNKRHAIESFGFM